MCKHAYMGSKHRGKHTTIIPSVERLIKWAEDESSIKGIEPNVITTVRRAGGRITAKATVLDRERLAVDVLGAGSKQRIILYTTNQDHVRTEIARLYR